MGRRMEWGMTQGRPMHPRQADGMAGHRRRDRERIGGDTRIDVPDESPLFRPAILELSLSS
jgi:hypothetical protein